MNEEQPFQPSIDSPVPQTPNLRIAGALMGAGILLTASFFLLGGGWDHAPTSGVSAGEEATPTNTRSAPTRALATPTIDWPVLVWIAAAAQPTPTQTPVPPAPTPEPQHLAPEAPPPASEAVAPVASGCPTQGMSGFALVLFNAINSSRLQYGMPSLAADGCVTYLAQVRSNDLAANGYFAHESPSGQSAFTLLDSYGIPSGWAGENLARNNYPTDQTVAVAIRDLMASPSHRENILNSHYSALGVAVTLDGTGIYYYTMIFVGA
jgi:uncharacterized protein YkwD